MSPPVVVCSQMTLPSPAPPLPVAEGAKPGCFRYFWITDSCPAAVDVARREPFEVLSLAAPIAAALQI